MLNGVFVLLCFEFGLLTDLTSLLPAVKQKSGSEVGCGKNKPRACARARVCVCVCVCTRMFESYQHMTDVRRC